MKPALIDTDILSMFFRGNPGVIAQFDTYLSEHGNINLGIITYYEILSGLCYRDAQRQLSLFLDFAAQNLILPLSERSVSISAQVYAELRKQGTPIDDIDLLIAGIAIANNLVLVTHNSRHFSRINALEIEDWVK